MNDYSVYKLNKKDFLIYGFIFVAFYLLISYLFYHNFFTIIFIPPIIYFYYKKVSIYLCKRRSYSLLLQFKDALNSISVSLKTGLSLESAIREAYLEVCILYSKTADMAIELDSINKQLNLNITIEKAFDNFSKRAVSDDIKTFCEVLNSAKRTGGDIISIISLTSDTISEKIDLKRDLNRILAAKKYEHRIMSLMPIFIMIYIESTSKGFFNPVYNNLLGIIFMTICLLIYALSAFLASKIIKEDV